MNDKVQVTEQLTAIDGIIAIIMTVTDIERSSRTKQSVVELVCTSMGYTRRPQLPPMAVNVTEEGYEVRAGRSLLLLNGATTTRNIYLRLLIAPLGKLFVWGLNIEVSIQF
jgi:hypothetical protein